MDVARERRLRALYETAVEWPRDARAARLAALPDDADMVAAVRAMLDRAGDPGGLATIPGHDPAEDVPPAPERIGAYRIVRELGRGGMGTVYLAERDDGVFEQRVAIKLIRHGLFAPGALARFAIERRILARLHHPHIAQLFDGGVAADGVSYIVMELLEGAAVTDHADALALGIPARLDLLAEAGGAVEHAHRNLVVHSDIKPSNVLVTADFGVKLLDFGIARLVGQTDTPTVRAHTPRFASPAQAEGLPPTPADDVHALGVLMQSLLADQPVDADLAAVVARAAAPDPADRYGAVSEWLADVARWRAYLPVEARAADAPHRAALYLRRHRLAVTIIAGAFALLATATAISTTLYLRADTAQRAAERRFEQTHRLSQFLIDDVTRALAPLPGSGPVRRAIAERENRTLDELSRVPDAPPSLMIDSANACARVGTILAGSEREDADPQAADRALGKAVADLESLSRQLPGEPALHLALDRARIDRAAFLGQAANDPAAALALLDRADRDLARGPRGGDRSIAAWDSALARAAILDGQGRFAENAPALRRLVQDYPALPLRHDVDRLLRIEQGLTLLASADYYLGRPQDALVSYRAARTVLETPAFASDARIIARRAYAAYNIASTLGETAGHAAALAAIVPGVADVERLRPFDASPAVRNMVNIVRLEYAMHLAGMRQFAAAVDQASRSIAGRRALAALQPDSYSAIRSVPVGLRPLGEMLRAAGQARAACATFGEADRDWAGIARRRPLSAFDATSERGIVRTALAACR